jgi:hypothetical protein
LINTNNPPDHLNNIEVELDDEEAHHVIHRERHRKWLEREDAKDLKAIHKIEKKLRKLQKDIDETTESLSNETNLLDHERGVCMAFVIFNEMGLRNWVLQRYLMGDFRKHHAWVYKIPLFGDMLSTWFIQKFQPTHIWLQCGH